MPRQTTKSYGAGFAITPGAALLPYTTKALLAAMGGTATVQMENGTSVTITLAAGVPLEIAVVKVTSAVATGIVGFA